MRPWLFLIAGAVVLLLFGGAVYARPMRDESGEFILPGFDGNQPTSEGGDMSIATWFSDKAVNTVKAEEGCKLSAYRDAAGWSIGYGHYLGLTKTVETISQEQAEAWLNEDMGNAAQLILDNVTVPLTQNQFDSLTSFLYNLGSKAIADKNGAQTTWLRLLNEGDYNGAAAQLTRWANSEGRINQVLVARREREKTLFLA